ncbi:SpoU rRNA Methylase family [Novymonas esmeraldas]|uniref:SpoU rRNA Methylase family n=1 Tax=Novymonas esmeraldas TaxID=1808958 RepID=A0AAW0EXI4_9TRYP
MFALSRCALRYASRRPSSFGAAVGRGSGSGGGSGDERRSAAASRRLHNILSRDGRSGSITEAEVVPPSAEPPHDGPAPAPRAATASAASTTRRPALLQQPTRPIVLESVQDTVSVSPTHEVHGRLLWSGTKVLSTSKHVRAAHAACVVGGASAIRRLWRVYGIRPSVVYVPDTESAVPEWCLRDDLPTVVVRCSPVAVRRQLLSAEYSDGYAAEFPLPVNSVSDAAALMAPPATAPADAAASSPPASPGGSERSATAAQPSRPLHEPFGYHAVKAMLVLVGLRIPSNVGALLRAAAEMGYDAAVLVNCVDPTGEKVLRASDGAALSPALRLYETTLTGQSCVSLLSSIAAQHHLLPLLAVPSQEVAPAFEVAKRLHVFNAARQATAAAAPVTGGAEGGLRAVPPPPLGAMVVLGSEAQGLRDLDGRWAVPYQLVTLPLPNPMVDSFNVGVAGSVLMHLFRPGAASHFTRLVELSGETVADLLPQRAEDDVEEVEDAAGDV